MRLAPIHRRPSFLGFPGNGKRAAAALVCASLAAGCADRLDKNEARLRPWLDERPRAMVVTLSTKPPTATVVERESRVLSGLIGFAGGALVGAALPWLGGGGFPDLTTAALVTAVGAAVGAIAGAVTFAWDPEETSVPIGDEPGLARLLEDRRFERMLQARVIALGAKRSRHRLRTATPGETEGWAGLPQDSDAAIGLGFGRLGFLDEGGDPPRYALYIRGMTSIARQWRALAPRTSPQGADIRRWKYEGTARSLSEWQADGGAPFDREMERAVEQLAEKIVAGLGANGEEEIVGILPNALAMAV